MADFPCTQCGQCCRHISSILAHSNYPTVVQDLVNRFPYEVNDDGSCSMLTEDGLCSVYDNRPIMCNINLMGQLLQQSQDDWHRKQADVCNELISNAGLSPDYLVKF
jgi:Fe-S-cluster containining protein